MQNWNDGKSQEYENRKLYDIKYLRGKKSSHIVTITEDDVDIQPMAKTRYLFTTSTCPNCKVAKTMLADEKVEVEVIDAEEHPDMARRFGIKQAPTLVVGNGESVDMYVNTSDIRRYIQEQR